MSRDVEVEEGDKAPICGHNTVKGFHGWATREGRYINVQILEELEAITVSYDYYVRCVQMLKCSVVGGTDNE